MLVGFHIWSLQRGLCSTSVYCVSLCVRHRVPEDCIRLVNVQNNVYTYTIILSANVLIDRSFHRWKFSFSMIQLYYGKIYKHLWSTIPPILKTKLTTTPHLKSLHVNKYHDTCRMKWWDLTSLRVLIGRPIENQIFNSNTDINKQ